MHERLQAMIIESICLYQLFARKLFDNTNDTNRLYFSSIATFIKDTDLVQGKFSEYRYYFLMRYDVALTKQTITVYSE